jgi:hypothetical protein
VSTVVGPTHVCDDRCAHTISECRRCSDWVRASRHTVAECEANLGRNAREIVRRARESMARNGGNA